MKVPLATKFQRSLIGVLIVMGVSGSDALAQETSDHRGRVPEHRSALVNAVRESTARFHDVAEAEREGYGLLFGCVSGPDAGAMGVHFVNFPLVDGVLEAERPEALIYEVKDGRARLLGVEYIVPVDAWHPKEGESPVPVLDGQVFHFVESPNRFGLPAFYELHVWAWRENPKGTFADWNPQVSCDSH